MKTAVKEKSAAVNEEEKIKREVTQDEIAERAYQLWLNRGCEHGHDVEDWQQAEEELQRKS